MTEFANGIHHFTQQIRFTDVVGSVSVLGTLDDVALEPVNFVGGHGAEIVVQRISGFELLAVDQERVRSRQRIASDVVEVPEQCEAAVLKCRRAIRVLPEETGDEVIDQLRDGRVLTDDDKAGRDFDSFSSQSLNVFS